MALFDAVDVAGMDEETLSDIVTDAFGLSETVCDAERSLVAVIVELGSSETVAVGAPGDSDTVLVFQQLPNDSEQLVMPKFTPEGKCDGPSRAVSFHEHPLWMEICVGTLT